MPTLSPGFAEDALKWAPDNDTVQTLLNRHLEWQLTRQDALQQLLQLASEGKLEFRDYDTETEIEMPLPATQLTMDHIDARY